MSHAPFKFTSQPNGLEVNDRQHMEWHNRSMNVEVNPSVMSDRSGGIWGSQSAGAVAYGSAIQPAFVRVGGTAIARSGFGLPGSLQSPYEHALSEDSFRSAYASASGKGAPTGSEGQTTSKPGGEAHAGPVARAQGQPHTASLGYHNAGTAHGPFGQGLSAFGAPRAVAGPGGKPMQKAADVLALARSAESDQKRLAADAKEFKPAMQSIVQPTLKTQGSGLFHQTQPKQSASADGGPVSLHAQYQAQAYEQHAYEQHMQQMQALQQQQFMASRYQQSVQYEYGQQQQAYASKSQTWVPPPPLPDALTHDALGAQQRDTTGTTTAAVEGGQASRRISEGGQAPRIAPAGAMASVSRGPVLPATKQISLGSQDTPTLTSAPTHEVDAVFAFFARTIVEKAGPEPVLPAVIRRELPKEIRDAIPLDGFVARLRAVPGLLVLDTGDGGAPLVSIASWTAVAQPSSPSTSAAIALVAPAVSSDRTFVSGVVMHPFAAAGSKAALPAKTGPTSGPPSAVVGAASKAVYGTPPAHPLVGGKEKAPMPMLSSAYRAAVAVKDSKGSPAAPAPDDAPPPVHQALSRTVPALPLPTPGKGVIEACATVWTAVLNLAGDIGITGKRAFDFPHVFNTAGLDKVVGQTAPVTVFLVDLAASLTALVTTALGVPPGRLREWLASSVPGLRLTLADTDLGIYTVSLAPVLERGAAVLVAYLKEQEHGIGGTSQRFEMSLLGTRIMPLRRLLTVSAPTQSEAAAAAAEARAKGPGVSLHPLLSIPVPSEAEARVQFSLRSIVDGCGGGTARGADGCELVFKAGPSGGHVSLIKTPSPSSGSDASMMDTGLGKNGSRTLSSNTVSAGGKSVAAYLLGAEVKRGLAAAAKEGEAYLLKARVSSPGAVYECARRPGAAFWTTVSAVPHVATVASPATFDASIVVGEEEAAQAYWKGCRLAMPWTAEAQAAEKERAASTLKLALDKMRERARVADLPAPEPVAGEDDAAGAPARDVPIADDGPAQDVFTAGLLAVLAAYGGPDRAIAGPTLGELLFKHAPAAYSVISPGAKLSDMVARVKGLQLFKPGVYCPPASQIPVMNANRAGAGASGRMGPPIPSWVVRVPTYQVPKFAAQLKGLQATYGARAMLVSLSPASEACEWPALQLVMLSALLASKSSGSGEWEDEGWIDGPSLGTSIIQGLPASSPRPAGKLREQLERAGEGWTEVKHTLSNFSARILPLQRPMVQARIVYLRALEGGSRPEQAPAATVLASAAVPAPSAPGVTVAFAHAVLTSLLSLPGRFILGAKLSCIPEIKRHKPALKYAESLVLIPFVTVVPNQTGDMTIKVLPVHVAAAGLTVSGYAADIALGRGNERAKVLTKAQIQAWVAAFPHSTVQGAGGEGASVSVSPSALPQGMGLGKAGGLADSCGLAPARCEDAGEDEAVGRDEEWDGGQAEGGADQEGYGEGCEGEQAEGVPLDTDGEAVQDALDAQTEVGPPIPRNGDEAHPFKLYYPAFTQHLNASTGGSLDVQYPGVVPAAEEDATGGHVRCASIAAADDLSGADGNDLAGQQQAGPLEVDAQLHLPLPVQASALSPQEGLAPSDSANPEDSEE